MKKVFGLVAAAAMMFSGMAFAEGYINANDLTKGDIVDLKEEEDGFVLIATADKPMSVDKAVNIDSTDGDIFTQRINLKGSGKTTGRAISFPAKKGEKVTVYSHSSNKAEARVLNLVNEDKEVIGTVAAEPLVDNGKASVGTVDIPADGTYYLYSAKNGIYVYQVKVGK